jgi:hypothetical protein
MDASLDFVEFPFCDFREEFVWVKLRPELEYSIASVTALAYGLCLALQFKYVLSLHHYKLLWAHSCEFPNGLQARRLQQPNASNQIAMEGDPRVVKVLLRQLEILDT